MMEEIALPDGRRAQLWTGAAASVHAVLVCHGTPDTRWIARTGASAAASAGVRLVCVNRPGYGTSTSTGSASTGWPSSGCPSATGRWWADRVSGAEPTVTPTTHLSTLLANWTTILATLRSHLT